MDKPVMSMKSVHKSSSLEDPVILASSSTLSVLSSVADSVVSISDQNSVAGHEPNLPNTVPGQKICPNCGKEVIEPETKLIPTQRAWLCFTLMFFCLLWWLSWIPFLVDKCKFKKPVQMCPHCYRRLDRLPV